MYDDRYLLAGSGVAILAGVALLASAGAFGALAPFDGPSMTESELAAFDAASPQCVDDPATNGSVTAHQVAGGTQLRLDRAIAVPTRSTDVNATFERVGPDRYVLAVQRESSVGRQGTDCDLRVRYDATVNLTHSDRYTVVLTHGDRLQAVYWSGPDTEGVVRRSGPNATDDSRTAKQ